MHQRATYVSAVGVRRDEVHFAGPQRSGGHRRRDAQEHSGPHHVGALRGAAWPHMFQQGPETGPPPGTRYDTIGYGLFEPFVITARGQ